MSDFQSPDSGANGGISGPQDLNPSFPPPDAPSAAPLPPFPGAPTDPSATQDYTQGAPEAYPYAPGYPQPGQLGQPGQPGYGQGPVFPPPGYGPYGYGVPGYAGPAYGGTNGLSIAALVCGICGFLCGIPAILAIVFGCIGLSQDKQRGQGGRGLAIAGIVLGSLWVIGTILLIAVNFTTSSSVN